MAGTSQALGQCADHVCESSRFGIWMNFAADEKDSHASLRPALCAHPSPQPSLCTAEWQVGEPLGWRTIPSPPPPPPPPPPPRGGAGGRRARNAARGGGLGVAA